MRKIIYALLLLGVLFYLMQFVQVFVPINKNVPAVVPVEKRVSEHYLANNKKETGAANVVTAVVVNYRGFDTLGEVTVLFLAMTGLLAVLHNFQLKKEELGEGTIILKTATKLLMILIFGFGFYIFAHGHLTPGGGFPAGAVIATGVFLLYTAFKDYSLHRLWTTLLESISGMGFIIVGIIGIYKGASFLYNFLPHGKFGSLLSGGVIPLIYGLIFLKVASELSALISQMTEGEKE